MNFGVDSAGNLFTLSKKDRSGQQQSKTSESMLKACVCYFLSKFYFSLNDSL